MPTRTPTSSVRLMWPFSRIVGTDARALGLLSDIGMGPMDLIERDRRVPCEEILATLQGAVEAFDDPTLGLRAGALSDEGTFDIVEHAARSTENLGQALALISRYFRMIFEACEFWIEEDGDRVNVCQMLTVPHSAAANDFVVAMSLSFARRNCVIYAPPLEVALMHPRPGYADAYAAHLQCPVSFDAPRNAITLPHVALQTPMAARNSALATAYEARMAELGGGHGPTASMAARTRALIVQQLARGPVQMEDIAALVDCSPATLRRALAAENTSFTELLEAVRKQAAEHHLRQQSATIIDIAFMLCFADVRAFGRAFRRWFGISATEYRERLLRGEPVPAADRGSAP